MSFFFESKRDTGSNFIRPTTTPSPAEYNNDYEHRISKGYAPFGSASKLDRGPLTKRDKQPETVVELKEQYRIITPPKKQMSSMFKSQSERVMAFKSEAPGPGAYDVNIGYQKQRQKIQSMNYSLTERKTNPPSIPTDSFGFKVVKDNEIEKIKLPKKQAPSPFSYDIRNSLLSRNRGVSWSNSVTLPRKQAKKDLPGPGQYNVLKKTQNKVPSSSFNSQTGRSEFSKKELAKMPGPGDYNIVDGKVKRHFSQSHFNSKIPRFVQKVDTLVPGPGAYEQNVNPVLTFNKKVLEGSEKERDPKRKTIFHEKNLSSNPGPGDYIYRQGMTFQLQKSLLRKYNQTQFPTSKREIFSAKPQEPGPGAYDPEDAKSSPSGGRIYKKVEVVNLKKEDEVVIPSPFHYSCNNHTIGHKVSKEAKRAAVVEGKPFSSGAQRFSHYKDHEKSSPRKSIPLDPEICMKLETAEEQMLKTTEKKTKKLVMTTVKVKVPFGTSSSKFAESDNNEDIGPGSYGSSCNWIKPSYNIKSKINEIA